MHHTPLGVGVIGLGRSGWHIHVAGLLKMPEHYRVAAVSDPAPESRTEAEQQLDCQVFTDPQQVIGHPDVAIVVVASPSHTHVPLALEALAAGKHVVIEKPMAASVGEIDQLTEAAAVAGRVVTCFHNNRFEASLRTITKLINEGRIGDPLIIRRCVHRYSRRTDWQTLRRFGGGELANQTSHYLDQMLTLVGDQEVTIAAADIRQTVSAGDAEDHVKLSLSVTDGPLIEIETMASVALPQPAWFVTGTAGGIVGSAQELTVRWLDPASLPEITATTGPAPGRRYFSSEVLPWQEEQIRVEPTDRTHVFYQNLYEVITAGAELAITPESVRRQVAILEDARTLSSPSLPIPLSL